MLAGETRYAELVLCGANVHKSVTAVTSIGVGWSSIGRQTRSGGKVQNENCRTSLLTHLISHQRQFKLRRQRCSASDRWPFAWRIRLENPGTTAIRVSINELLRSDLLERGQLVLVLGAEAGKYLYGGFVYVH